MGRPLPFTNPTAWYHRWDARKTVKDRAIEDGLLGTEYSPFDDTVPLIHEGLYAYRYEHPKRPHPEKREINRWRNKSEPPFYTPDYAKFGFRVPKGDHEHLFMIYEEVPSTHSPNPDYIPVYWCPCGDDEPVIAVTLKTNTNYARQYVAENKQRRFRRFFTSFSDGPLDSIGYWSNYGYAVEWLD